MRILQPLRDRVIAALWGGLVASAVGDQLYAVALSWIAVGVFGTAAGYLSALHAATILVTALACGGWVDTWKHRPVMIGADIARAVVLIVVVLAWMIVGRPPAWGLILAVLVLAAGQILFRPALQATLPDLVADHGALPAVNALFDSTYRIAFLLGPGVVALLAAWLPITHFFSLDAATFIISALAVIWIRRLGYVASPLSAGSEGMLLSVTRGFRVMWHHRLLAYVLITKGIINGAWYAAMFLGVPLMIEKMGITGPGSSGQSAYGLVISCYGVTNLLATLVVGGYSLPERPARLMCSGNMTVGFGIFLLGLAMLLPLPDAARLPCFMAAAAFAAIGGPMSDITIATMRQTLLARNDIAPAMRASMVMDNTGLLIAMLLAPVALNAFGISAVVIFCGCVIVIAGLVGLLRLSREIPRLALVVS